MAAAAADAEEEAADADIKIIACGAGVMPDVIRHDAFLFLQVLRLRPGTTIPQERKILI